jgi:hypothetical protein
MASGVLTLAFAVYCLTGFRGREMDYVMTAVIPPYSWSGESDQISWVMVENDYDSARELALVEGKKLFLNFTGYT